jgi:hypothetical protein
MGGATLRPPGKRARLSATKLYENTLDKDIEFESSNRVIRTSGLQGSRIKRQRALYFRRRYQLQCQSECELQ